MSWKTSPLVRYKILELFGYTFGADHMYSRQRWEKLTQQVQTLLSQNVVSSIPECPCFRTTFQIQSVYKTQTVLQPARQHFYLNFPLI